MKSFIAAAMFITSFSALAQNGGSLELLQKGKQVTSLDMKGLTGKVKPVEIKVWEPHEDKDVVYEAFPANKLFTAVYGDGWQNQEEVLFTCSDGYQPSIPVERFKKHRAYFAFKRKDQTKFVVQNRFHNQKNVELGPFYLVWNNRTSKELKAKGGSGWPYQVVSVDLVSFADRFPKVSPPANASAAAKAGFLAFRENCMSCHTVNGDGGKKAPELNYPTNVTEYLSDGWFKKWVYNPRAVRFNATMPSFEHLPNKEQIASNVLAYLKSMKSRKIKPAEKKGGAH